MNTPEEQKSFGQIAKDVIEAKAPFRLDEAIYEDVAQAVRSAVLAREGVRELDRDNVIDAVLGESVAMEATPYEVWDKITKRLNALRQPVEPQAGSPKDAPAPTQAETVAEDRDEWEYATGIEANNLKWKPSETQLKRHASMGGQFWPCLDNHFLDTRMYRRKRPSSAPVAEPAQDAASAYDYFEPNTLVVEEGDFVGEKQTGPWYPAQESVGKRNFMFFVRRPKKPSAPPSNESVIASIPSSPETRTEKQTVEPSTAQRIADKICRSFEVTHHDALRCVGRGELAELITPLLPEPDAALNSELTQWKQNCANLQSRLELEERQFVTLRAECEGLKASNEARAKDGAAYVLKLAELQSQIAALTAERDRWKHSADQWQDTWRRSTEALRNERDEQKQKAEALQKENEELKVSNASYYRLSIRNDEELSRLRTQGGVLTVEQVRESVGNTMAPGDWTPNLTKALNSRLTSPWIAITDDPKSKPTAEDADRNGNVEWLYEDGRIIARKPTEMQILDTLTPTHWKHTNLPPVETEDDKTQDVADLLNEIGWIARNDAQHDQLKKSIPKLTTILNTARKGKAS